MQSLCPQLSFSPPSALRRRLKALFSPVSTALLVATLLGSSGGAVAQHASVDFRQYANKASSNSPDWVEGILNQHNSEYYEGTSTLQRVVLMDVPPNATAAVGHENEHVLRFNHEAQRGGPRHAYDFLTGMDRAMVDYQTLVGRPITAGMFSVVRPGSVAGRNANVENVVSARYSDLAATHRRAALVPAALDMTMAGMSPDPTAQMNSYDAWTGGSANRAVMIYGDGDITAASLVFTGYSGASNQYADYELRWTSASSNVLILMAGHLSIGTGGYGGGKGSSAINGAPYHVRLNSLDNDASVNNNSGGSRDNQINQILPLTACGLQLMIGESDVACYGEATGSITLTASGVAGPYTFTLTRVGGAPQTRTIAAATTTFGGLSAGTYQASVSVSSTCATPAVDVTVIEPIAALDPTVTKTDALCYGSADGTITISASGGTAPYRYSIANGPLTDFPSNPFTLSGFGVGAYSVRVVDAHDCEALDGAVVGQPPVLTLNLSKTDVLCHGNATGTITVAVEGGTLPYRYSLNGGALVDFPSIPFTIENLYAGIYSVRVVDANDCEKTMSREITQPTQLDAIATKTDVLCYGGSTGTITVSASGGTAPYRYSIAGGTLTDFPGNPFTLDGFGVGAYSVRVVDAHNCEVTRGVVIGQPTQLTMTLESTNVNCYNGTDGTLRISAGGGTAPYRYSLNGGALLPFPSNPFTIGSRPAGTYSVRVVDAKDCEQTRTRAITQPTQLNAIATKTDVLCYGGSTGTIRVSASGGTAPYRYSIAGGALTAFPSNPFTLSGFGIGAYSVRVVDAHNCEVTRGVVIGQPPLLMLGLTPHNVPCHGDRTGSIDVLTGGGTPSYGYFLDGSAIVFAAVIGLPTNPFTIEHLAAGPHTVRVVDHNGCEKSQTVNITEPPVLALTLVGTTPASCPGNDGSLTVTASGGVGLYTYVLMLNNLTVATNHDGIFANLTNGAYTVTVTDENHCVKDVTASVGRVPCCTLTQGFYGNAGGTACPPAGFTYSGSGGFTAQMMTYLIGPGGLRIGSATAIGGSLAITSTDAACLIQRMPGGGPSGAILGQNSFGASCLPGTIPLKNGRFSNTLLSQTITLGLNLRMNSGAMGNMVIANQVMQTAKATSCGSTTAVAGTTQSFTFPAGAVGRSISQLYALANTALAGTPTSMSASDLTAALGAINGGFDECRILMGFSPLVTQVVARGTATGTTSGLSAQFELNAYPNPTETSTVVEFRLPQADNAQVVVYSALGQRVATLFDGPATAGKLYQLPLDVSHLAIGVYSYSIRTSTGSQTLRLVVQ